MPFILQHLIDTGIVASNSLHDMILKIRLQVNRGVSPNVYIPEALTIRNLIRVIFTKTVC